MSQQHFFATHGTPLDMPPARTVGRPSLPMPSPLLTHWGAGTWSCSCWSSSSHPSLYLTQNLLHFFGSSRFFYFSRTEPKLPRRRLWRSVSQIFPSPPKMPRRQNPLRFSKTIFAIAKYRSIVCGIFPTHAQCAWKKPQRTLTTHTLKYRWVILLWPLPSYTHPPLCNPRVRAWKDCT